MLRIFDNLTFYIKCLQVASLPVPCNKARCKMHRTAVTASPTPN